MRRRATMPTDDERREVAERLREIRPCKSGHIKWWEIAQALGLKQPAGWFGWEKFEPDSVDRLADYIDPPYPDATASYKGWRAEVYDPDGVLASPSNVAVDLVRAHADGKMRHSTKEEQNEYSAMLEKMSVELHPVDRDALLEEVKELEKCAWYFGLDFDEDEPLRDRLKEASEDFAGSADRIRKALGVES